MTLTDSDIRQMIRVLQEVNVPTLPDGGYILRFEGEEMIIYPKNYQCRK